MDKKNCREYCRFAQHCYSEGEPGLDPDDCPKAWRIEDCVWDAECARREEPIEEPDDPDDWEE